MASLAQLRRRVESLESERSGKSVDGLRQTVATMADLGHDFERAEVFEILPPPDGLPPRWYPLFRHGMQHRLCESTARVRIVPAGRRSGKTERAKRILVRAALAFDKFPDGRFIAAAPTRDQARDLFWWDLQDLVPNRYVRSISVSTLTIHLVNGASISVVGLDKPARVEGKPIDGIVVDEFGDTKPDAWPRHIRPALSTIGREGWAIITGVPRGGRHYKAMYERALSDDNPDWEGFHWTSAEILPEAEIAAARAELDPITFAAEYEASFETTTARVYYAFDRQRHCVPLTYEPKRPLVFCFDFNVEPGVAVVLQEQTHDGTQKDGAGQAVDRNFTAVLDEVYVSTNSTTPRVCAELVKGWASRHRGPVFCYGDPAGGARHTSNVRGSDWDIIRDHLIPHWPSVLIKVDRAAPAIRSRTSAVNARLLTADDTAHMLIDPACQHLMIDLEDVVPDDHGDPDKKQSKELTHESDSLGYFCAKVHPLHIGPARTTPIG